VNEKNEPKYPLHFYRNIPETGEKITRSDRPGNPKHPLQLRDPTIAKDVDLLN
jgi:hypothetical protein